MASNGRRVLAFATIACSVYSLEVQTATGQLAPMTEFQQVVKSLEQQLADVPRVLEEASAERSSLVKRAEDAELAKNRAEQEVAELKQRNVEAMQEIQRDRAVIQEGKVESDRIVKQALQAKAQFTEKETQAVNTETKLAKLEKDRKEEKAGLLALMQRAEVAAKGREKAESKVHELTKQLAATSMQLHKAAEEKQGLEKEKKKVQAMELSASQEMAQAREAKTSIEQRAEQVEYERKAMETKLRTLDEQEKQLRSLGEQLVSSSGVGPIAPGAVLGLGVGSYR